MKSRIFLRKQRKKEQLQKIATYATIFAEIVGVIFTLTQLLKLLNLF